LPELKALPPTGSRRMSANPIAKGAGVRQALLEQQQACHKHAHEFGIDPSEITDWQWPF
jgi:phosphoketolase